MQAMVPPDLIHLGYPDAFPGDGYPAAQHQFDSICNHAVFNYDRFASYLRSDPVWFTILREPVSRAISAFNYFAGGPRVLNVL